MTSTQRGKLQLITTRPTPGYIGPVRAEAGFRGRDGLVDETGIATTLRAGKTDKTHRTKMTEVRCGATRFRIVAEIAADRVYEVSETKTGIKGILKVIDVEDAQVRERTKREAKILKTLRGNGTARIIGEGVLPDSRAFIILEKIEGKTYKEHLDLDKEGGKCKVNFSERVGIMIEFVKAIGELHAKGIYHRDLKPENVMVTKEGKIVIIDFGIAKREEDPQLTTIGMTLGTVAYLPPEQLGIRHDYKLEASADIYAAGVMIFETAFLRQIDFTREVKSPYHILEAKTSGRIFSSREMDLLDLPDFAREARINYDSIDYQRRISRIEVGGEERLNENMRERGSNTLMNGSKYTQQMPTKSFWVK